MYENVRPKNNKNNNGLVKTQNKKLENITYQRIRSQTQVCQTHHQANMIRPITENIKTKYLIKVKTIGSAQNSTHHTHHRATLIRPTKVIIKSRDAIKRITTGKKKQDPIKLCAKLLAKLPTTAYKLKILKSKLDEDLLHHRIYFLTLI